MSAKSPKDYEFEHEPLRRQFLTIPNLLTALRIAIVPLIIYLLRYTDRALIHHLIATGLFSVALITDYLDGFLARKTERVTLIGKLMDPLADKLIITSGLILLVSLRLLSPLLAIVMISREMYVNSLRSFASARGIMISASHTAKAKTFMQAIAIAFLMLGKDFTFLNIPWRLIGNILIYLALVLAILSALDYSIRFYYLVKQQTEEKGAEI